MAAGWHKLPRPEDEPVMFAALRKDPRANRLRTPSGLIEIYSEKVAGFGYPDCPGHAAWNEPDEWLGAGNAAYPLHLLGKQPRTKLHSQLDPGTHSQSGKVRGHEAVEINSRDAAARGIADGDLVIVRNERGGCIGGAVVSEDLMPGVVMVSTGAWSDPLAGTNGEAAICKHGNPNVLAPDVATSPLSQGLAAHSCLVEITRYEGPPVEVTAFEPPRFVARRDGKMG